MEEDKPLGADAGDLELGSSESQEDVSTAEDLETESPAEAEYYQRLTGRKDIKSKEDFEKHYLGLKKLVGDQAVAEMRKKAEAYEKLQKEIEKEADEFLSSPEGKETLEDFKKTIPQEEIASLRGKIEEMELLGAHPEAKNYLDILYSIANQKEVSLKEAYEGYLKDLVSSKLEAEKKEEEEQSIGVVSKARTTSSKASKLNQLVQEFTKQPRPTDEAKEALVKEWFSE